MDHSAEQWASLQLELELLRQENKNLKQEIQDLKSQEQFEAEMNLIKSTIHLHRNHMKKSCSREEGHGCKFCQPQQKSKAELVSQLQSWSEKLSITLFKKREPQFRRSISSQNKDSPIKQSQSEKEQQSFIEKICLFGPKEESSLQMSSKKLRVPHQLYFPKKDPLFSLYESYGCSLFPQAVEVKVVRQKHKVLEVDKIIFRKSLKPTDCKLIIFQSQKDGQFCLPNNTVKKRLNPFNIVYCVSVDFTDFLFEDQPYHGMIDKTVSLSEEKAEEMDIALSLEKGPASPDKNAMPSMLKRDSSVYGETSIFKSCFSLTVMSCYPFINFFCQFLLELINYIKIKRIEEHTKNPTNLSKIDIKQVVYELEKTMSSLKPLFDKEVTDSMKFEYQLGPNKVSFGINGIKDELSRDWAYRMLRLLDKDTLYQIFCLVISEESICFFSQSSYILNFMIYLFVGLLMQPFSYPFTIVSSIFELDHLQTPFIAVMGLNKPLKWLQENQQQLIQKISGKVLVILSEQQIKIKSKKKFKHPKSDRLRKIFGNFYKRVQKLETAAKKKQILIKQISKAENDIVQQLMTEIQTFFQEELFRYMPNAEIIDSIRKQLLISNPNVSTVTAKLINTISQYVAESRRNIEKDPFIEMLVQKQIFSVYLTIKYDIV